MIIVLAGPIGSGKSTLSRSLAEALGVRAAGFGDYIRDQATRVGLDVRQRQVLQDLGQRLVGANPRAFLDAALTWAGHQKGNDLVLDGLRHMAILSALREREAEGLDAVLLLYLDTPSEARQERVRARGESVDEVRIAERHPAESDLYGRLRAAADVILQGSATLSAITDEALGAIISAKGSRPGRPLV